MKLTILLFATGILAACAGSKNQSNQELEIVSATSQSWAGGAIGSGYGTNYEIEVRYGGSHAVSFDTLWVGTQAFVPEVKEKEGLYTLFAKFTSKPKRDPQTGEIDETEYINNPPKSENPPTFEGEGMLVYRLGKSRFTRTIPDLEQKQQLNYP